MTQNTNHLLLLLLQLWLRSPTFFAPEKSMASNRRDSPTNRAVSDLDRHSVGSHQSSGGEPGPGHVGRESYPGTEEGRMGCVPCPRAGEEERSGSYAGSTSTPSPSEWYNAIASSDDGSVDGRRRELSDILADPRSYAGGSEDSCFVRPTVEYASRHVKTGTYPPQSTVVTTTYSDYSTQTVTTPSYSSGFGSIPSLFETVDSVTTDPGPPPTFQDHQPRVMTPTSVHSLPATDEMRRPASTFSLQDVTLAPETFQLEAGTPTADDVHFLSQEDLNLALLGDPSSAVADPVITAADMDALAGVQFTPTDDDAHSAISQASSGKHSVHITAYPDGRCITPSTGNGSVYVSTTSSSAPASIPGTPTTAPSDPFRAWDSAVLPLKQEPLQFVNPAEVCPPRPAAPTPEQSGPTVAPTPVTAVASTSTAVSSSGPPATWSRRRHLGSGHRKRRPIESPPQSDDDEPMETQQNNDDALVRLALNSQFGMHSNYYSTKSIQCVMTDDYNDTKCTVIQMYSLHSTN